MSNPVKLEEIKSVIEMSCLKSHRQQASVHLLAVSKMQTSDSIRQVYQMGIKNFAENYLQEFFEKKDSLKDLNINWHFIGRIQSNKVKSLVGEFHCIHSVDRLSVLEKIIELASRKRLQQKIFLQCNLAKESSKGGVILEELKSLWELALKSSEIDLQGLMIMPPFVSDAENNRSHFRKAREILDELNSSVLERSGEINGLSMGTSQDYAVAIEEGATWIRLGTVLFGERKAQ